MEISTLQTIRPSVRQRPADRIGPANEGVVEYYGDLVLALARKFTASTEEAEAAAIEIFTDIRRHADNTFEIPSPEYLQNDRNALHRLTRLI